MIWGRQSHVPLEDIQKLGQLVQAHSSQDPAYSGDSRVVFGCLLNPIVLV